MTNRFNILIIHILILFSYNCWSQSTTSNIKIHGQLFDQVTEEPVVGAIIESDSNVFCANENGEFSFMIDSNNSGTISIHSIGYREIKIINIQSNNHQIDIEKIPMFTAIRELISYPSWMPLKCQLWRTKRYELRQRKKSNKKIAEMKLLFNDKEFMFHTFNNKDDVIVDLNESTKHNKRYK